MKFYPSVTTNTVPENDRTAWLYLLKLMETELKKEEIENLVFENFSEQLEKAYPELPTKMVWGNYLIFEFFKNGLSLSIDYEDKDDMMIEIVRIAKENNLVVFEPKTEKIYRP